MRTFLIVLAATMFFYIPFTTSRGRDVVNMGIVLTLFSFFAKTVPRRCYH